MTSSKTKKHAEERPKENSLKVKGLKDLIQRTENLREGQQQQKGELSITLSTMPIEPPKGI